MLVDLLIPIVSVTVTGTVIVLYFFFRHRSRTEMQKTVRTALERGQELGPGLIEQLGEPKRTPQSDLRRGTISLGIALSIGLFGVVLGEHDAIRPMLAISTLPLFVGLAYLALWFFSSERRKH